MPGSDNNLPTVCVDCSPLLVRSAGVKTWLYHWVNALRALRPGGVQTFLAPPDGPMDHSAGILQNPGRLALLQALNYLPLGVARRFPKCDVFHASNLLRNLPARPRLSATLHDLTAWIVPEFHREIQVASDKLFAERVLRRAHGIIAVSENTRADAIRILGLEPDKITVIPPGVSGAYFNVSNDEVERLAALYGLRKPYFLFNGTIEPRKNVGTLLAAWESLAPSFQKEMELIIVGMPGWNCKAILRKLASLNQRRASVRYLGYLPERDLPGVTAGALAMAYPSFYEGFGLPVVQAMAAGCPVITSRVSSLPEVTGGAAVLVDPQSESEIANAIRSVAESPALRMQLRLAGLERARHYTWDAAGRRSLKYFDDLV